MNIDVKAARLVDEHADALLIGAIEGESHLGGLWAELDSLLAGALLKVVELGDITGKRGEVTVIHALEKLPCPRVVVVGLGGRDKLSKDVVRGVVANAARRLRLLGVSRLAVEPIGALGIENSEAIGEAIAEGVLLGLYQFNRHKSSPDESAPLKHLTIVAGDDAVAAELRAGAERGRILAGAANLARDLENEPSNYMTPTELASQALSVADEAGLECQVLDREDMVELGMGALLGVAKGSHEEPKFIVLAYRGDPSTDRAIGFIGKGVTFDTGGISIKPAQGMEEMKGDMSGGASVIAALKAIAELKPRINVTGIVPATENMPGGAAIKPGDVLVAMNGKTIEVINTDAEGRLILADAISYARRLDLSPIIDIATLTGAVSIALGDVALGLFSNSDQLVDQLKLAADEAGEKVWQLPLFDEYREQIKSEIADIKNTGGRKAGSATAAWFLAEFVDTTPWAHLDIAGVDTYEHEKGWIVKGASGIPVRTLVHFALDRAAESESGVPEAAAAARD